ncbi:uncharacterized protein METZ01_LOCUS3653, partial [marine metagenome]
VRHQNHCFRLSPYLFYGWKSCLDPHIVANHSIPNRNIQVFANQYMFACEIKLFHSQKSHGQVL